MSRFPALASLLLLSLWLSACDRHAEAPVIDLDAPATPTAPATSPNTAPPATDARPAWRFGFELRTSPAEDARQYLSFLAWLENASGEKFRLVFPPARARLADLLGRNKLDFAALGAVSYIRAHHDYGARILVRGLNPEGRAEYRSCLVTRPDSPVRSVSDLRHRLLAFGSPSSTQGHLIPRILLRQAGLTLADLAGHRYTGSHQACAEAVLSRRFDACGMQDTLARRLAREGRLRILTCSRPYPSSGIAAAPGVPAASVAKIRRALLDFDPAGRHHEGLYHWNRTEMPRGFIAASDADYAELAKWMREFGMLDPARSKAGTP